VVTQDHDFLKFRWDSRPVMLKSGGYRFCPIQCEDHHVKKVFIASLSVVYQ
jgi:hypothetical protein